MATLTKGGSNNKGQGKGSTKNMAELNAKAAQNRKGSRPRRTAKVASVTMMPAAPEATPVVEGPKATIDKQGFIRAGGIQRVTCSLVACRRSCPEHRAKVVGLAELDRRLGREATTQDVRQAALCGGCAQAIEAEGIQLFSFEAVLRSAGVRSKERAEAAEREERRQQRLEEQRKAYLVGPMATALKAAGVVKADEPHPELVSSN